jgi:hypothetical protein
MYSIDLRKGAPDSMGIAPAAAHVAHSDDTAIIRAQDQQGHAPPQDFDTCKEGTAPSEPVHVVHSTFVLQEQHQHETTAEASISAKNAVNASAAVTNGRLDGASATPQAPQACIAPAHSAGEAPGSASRSHARGTPPLAPSAASSSRPTTNLGMPFTPIARLMDRARSADSPSTTAQTPTPAAATPMSGRPASAAKASASKGGVPPSLAVAFRASPKLMLISPKTLARDMHTPEWRTRDAPASAGGRSQPQQQDSGQQAPAAGGRRAQRAAAAASDRADGKKVFGGATGFYTMSSMGPGTMPRGGDRFGGVVSRSATFALSSMDRSGRSLANVDFRPKWRV